MFKNIFRVSFVLIVTLTLTICATIILSADSDIRVFIGEQEVNFTDQRPVIVEGRTLVPIRDVFEAMGFVVEWDEETRAALLSYNDGALNISIEIGAPYFGVGIFDPNAPVGHGVIVPLDVPAQIIGGRTMLPLRALLEHIGYELEWDEVARAVMINARTADIIDDAPAPVVNIRHLIYANLDDVRDVLGNQISYTHSPGSSIYFFDTGMRVFVRRNDDNERIIIQTLHHEDMDVSGFAFGQIIGSNLDDMLELFGEIMSYTHYPDLFAYHFASGLRIITEVDAQGEKAIIQVFIDYTEGRSSFHFDQIRGGATLDEIIIALGLEPLFATHEVATFSISEEPYKSVLFQFDDEARVKYIMFSGRFPDTLPE